MERSLVRAYFFELIGTFALVFMAAGTVCVNHMTTPQGQQPATAALNGHQPGLVGVALAQGLILAVMLAITIPVSGGYLNPAVTLMLWVFNRLDSARASWFIGAQLLGGVLAGMVLRYTFDSEVLQAAHAGAPHLNRIVYGTVLSRDVLLAGTGIELILTFFVVFAIFGIKGAEGRPGLAGLAAGAALTACVLLGFPLTGAATNPARWFGPVLWEFAVADPTRGPMADVFVYVAGPILGALIAGFIAFKVLKTPDRADDAEARVDGARSTAIKAKK